MKTIHLSAADVDLLVACLVDHQEIVLTAREKSYDPTRQNRLEDEIRHNANLQSRLRDASTDNLHNELVETCRNTLTAIRIAAMPVRENQPGDPQVASAETILGVVQESLIAVLAKCEKGKDGLLTPEQLAMIDKAEKGE